MSEQINLFKSNTISNILLIAILFFVVYYLCKQKSVDECFANCLNNYDPVKCCDKGKNDKMYGNSCKAKAAKCKKWYKKFRSEC